jgi:HEPN domain-containing protein
MKKDEIIKYWLKSADADLKVMNSLLKNRHYAWALFLGHLVTEKLLKAVYVKNIGMDVPYIHNLVRIAEESKLELTEEQKDFLAEVTTFNIKARYSDYKGRFHRKATKKFTECYITKIKEFRKWLLKKIKK